MIYIWISTIPWECQTTAESHFAAGLIADCHSLMDKLPRNGVITNVISIKLPLKTCSSTFQKILNRMQYSGEVTQFLTMLILSILTVMLTSWRTQPRSSAMDSKVTEFTQQLVIMIPILKTSLVCLHLEIMLPSKNGPLNGFNGFQTRSNKRISLIGDIIHLTSPVSMGKSLETRRQRLSLWTPTSATDSTGKQWPTSMTQVTCLTGSQTSLVP